MGHVHNHPIHPGHLQGDLPYPDGSRMFFCTKLLRDGHRTAMLYVGELFRLDVTGRGDEVEIRLRNLTGVPISGGVEQTIQHRRTKAWDQSDTVDSYFQFQPLEGAVGEVRFTITRPATRGERFVCTAMAHVKRRES